jgi:predicted hotdog family 3-hydroxylacyl-ACP dehydratase
MLTDHFPPGRVLIGRDALCALIPHAGSMCLLDGVLGWDATSIACISATHRNADHPLRDHGRLAAINAIEYGAQAAAVHGGLLARGEGRQAPPAYLAAVRDAELAMDDLDRIEGPLTVSAWLLHADGGGIVYRCAVDAGSERIAAARISMLYQIAVRP